MTKSMIHGEITSCRFGFPLFKPFRTNHLYLLSTHSLLHLQLGSLHTEGDIGMHHLPNLILKMRFRETGQLSQGNTFTKSQSQNFSAGIWGFKLKAVCSLPNCLFTKLPVCQDHILLFLFLNHLPLKQHKNILVF